MDEVRLEVVKKLEIQPGDIVHIQLGGDLGDGQGPWIPTASDIAQSAAAWNDVLPGGTPVVISHHLEQATIIRHALRNTSWPPKVVIHD